MSIMFIIRTVPKTTRNPVKNLSPQLSHWELTLQLILRALSYLTVNSQDDSHCELAVSLLWVCSSYCELAVSYS